MMEREFIQQRGFKNVYKNGQIVGFQVRYRINYYRGIWLSLEEGVEIAVDGEKFSDDQIAWTIGGKTYTQKEMAGITDVQWPYLEPAILTVAKPGGLALGGHDVQITEKHRISYIPASETGGGFGGPSSAKRRLYLVK